MSPENDKTKVPDSILPFRGSSHPEFGPEAPTQGTPTRSCLPSVADPKIDKVDEGTVTRPSILVSRGKEGPRVSETHATDDGGEGRVEDDRLRVGPAEGGGE